MVDFLRSAVSYLSGGSAGGERGSEFVGQVVDLGEGLRLKVKKVIAEGGYGFVFVAQDLQSGKDYALKRQVVATDKVKEMKKEIAFLKQLKGHPHIIEFITAAGIPPSHGGAEFMILTELVTGGNLVDVVNSQRLSPRQVLRVFHQSCLAVAHMHSQKPPIIHRDLKVENLLLTSEGNIKLCDFGSATTKQVTPDYTWTAVQRGLAEDEIHSNTTPMYRSPEMIDLYSDHPINTMSDIWALGCLLYKLCYQEHPFEDSARLRILNANYHIPPEDSTYTVFQPIIRSCLKVNPVERPSVDGIIAQLYSVADKLRVNLDEIKAEPIVVSSPSPIPPSQQAQPKTQGLASETQPTTTSQTDPGATGSGMEAVWQSTSHQAHKLFGMMKGGAGNILKNIKDTSSKVVSGMQGRSASKQVDISYITTRILVMSFPHEDGSAGNSLDEVKNFLDEHHPAQYLVFNLSGEEYDTSRLHGQVADYEWPVKSVPALESIVDLCRNLDSWLRADPGNVLVVHCTDGVKPSSLLVVAYLLFLRAFSSPRQAFQLFTTRRMKVEEGAGPLIVDLTASEFRYMQYIADLVGSTPYKPHSHSLSLRMLRLSTVPLYNLNKTGCKPFVEMYVNGERVFTSATKDSMDKIRSFGTDDQQVEIPLGVSVQGNVLIIVHHIRSLPVAKAAGMGMSAVKMLQFQFHTGFISLQAPAISFERHELDGSAARRLEKFPAPFTVKVEFEEEPVKDGQEQDPSWQNLPHSTTSPLLCFSSKAEQEDTSRMFGSVSSGNQNHGHFPQDIPFAPLTEESPEPPTDDLLSGGLSHGMQPSKRPEMKEYIRYRNEGESSSASSTSSDSSRGETEGTFDPFSKLNKEKGSSHQQRPVKTATNPAVTLDPFSSNPSAAAMDLEEADLLEFSITEEDSNTSLPSTQASNQPTSGQRQNSPSLSNPFDPFASWGDSSGEAKLSSATQPPQPNESLSANTKPSASFPAFSSSQPSSTANTLTAGNFDPFASSSAQDGEDDLMAFMGEMAAPLKPTTATDRENFPPSASDPNFRSSQPTASSWSIFTSTSTTSSAGHNQKGWDDIWSKSVKSQQPKSYDPFSEFANFGELGSSTAKPQDSSSKPGPQSKASSKMPSSPMTKRPAYHMYGQRNANLGVSTPGSGSRSGSASPAGRSPSPAHYPNYSSSSSSRGDERSNKSKYGPVPNLGKSQFGDLLDPTMFSSQKPDDGPVSLRDMKKKNAVEKAKDPDSARVEAWAEGKERNIRALISSLHTILWEGETRWKQVGMHQLIEPDQVKKFYRRACLSVHPDKSIGTKHENLARAIFDELNDAYEKFEESGSQPLYF